MDSKSQDCEATSPFPSGAAIAAPSALQGETAQGATWDRLFGQAAVGTICVDTGLHCLRVNPRFAAMLGYAPEELIGKSVREFTHPEDGEISQQALKGLSAASPTCQIEKRYLHKDGSAVWVSMSISGFFDAAGRLQSYLAVMEDVTERRSQAELLDHEKRILQQIAAGMELGPVLEEIALLWEQRSAHYPYCAVTLRSADGERAWVAAAPRLPCAFRGMMWRASGEPTLFTGELESSVTDLAADAGAIRDGGILLSLGLRACWRLPVLGSHGRVIGALIAFSPHPASPGDADRALMERLGHLVRIAIDKSQVEQEVTQLSSFDALTGLPNRAFLLERLGRALAQGTRQGRRTALLLLNLDGMSRINESLGYAFGDEFIKAVARRLREHLKQSQTLARSGGDEFALLIEDAGDEMALTERARALLACINRPLQVAGQEMFVTASLGADLASGGVDGDALFRHVDAALHRAKARGGNSLRLYAPDMDASASRLQLLGELNRALERGEFRVYYQPQLDLHEGGVAGAEALIRWQHPRRGLVSPAEFIPLLEETGLILPVGEWFLRQVCRDIAKLTEEGCPAPRIAVNLSPRQFHQPDLAARIAALVRDSGVDGWRLEVELTETLMVQEPELTAQCLQELKRLGVAVAVDDFGVGYSSLAYLKRFPVDVLKIDKSFVDGVADCPADAAIVDAIVHMAHSLGMHTVAEGVETAAQRRLLESHGCDVLQGYLYSEPLPFGGFAAFLSGHGMTAPAIRATA